MNLAFLRSQWAMRVLTGIAGVTLVLVLVNIFLFLGNRSIQDEVNARQQFINQSLALGRLNQEIVSALANLAARNNDDQLRHLLSQHGITFTVNPPASGPTKAQR